MTHTCTQASLSGSGVIVEGHSEGQSVPPPSDSGRGSPPAPGPNRDAPLSGGSEQVAPAPNPLPWDYFDHCDIREPVCQSQFFHMSSAPDPAHPVPQTVTLDDVAGFLPHDASLRSQPKGWAVAGTPANFLTDAVSNVIDGQLLNRPAQVRFVPVSFTWNYGDGTISTTDGPGASWKQLGQQDFTTTDTSHVYPTMGDRQVTLTIAYAPSYRFDGGGWQQIPGTLPVQVVPVTIHVLQGSTVLVGGACGTRHAGPGC
ncbi:hypothetical protein [Clavibacter capsici]|uniref:hypothetical protein n=1 Tax=Clavibacter capsici TaxID=1874630 RepID=UPI001FFD4DF8|nr:hypothetical protein [Clavibacter capsici]